MAKDSFCITLSRVCDMPSVVYSQYKLFVFDKSCSVLAGSHIYYII